MKIVGWGHDGQNAGRNQTLRTAATVVVAQANNFGPAAAGLPKFAKRQSLSHEHHERIPAGSDEVVRG